jgi:hypothetical protein
MSSFNVLVDAKSGTPGALPVGECAAFKVTVSDEGKGYKLVVEATTRGSGAPLPDGWTPGRLSSAFYSSTGAHSALIAVEEGKFAVRVNRMMVFIHRLIGELSGQFAGMAPVDVTIRSRLGPDARFTADVPLGMVFPSTFNFNFMEVAITDFTTPHSPPLRRVSMSEGVTGDVVMHSDEVLGDVASSVSGFNAQAESPRIGADMPAPLKVLPAPLKLGKLADAALARPQSGNAKLRWLANFMAVSVEPDAPVLVAGDHPGTFSRTLASLGRDVVGVDPLNSASTVRANPALGSGTYEQRRGHMSVNTGVDDYGVDWGGVFCDVGVAENSAEADTAVNLGLMASFLREGVGVGIAKVRSVPRVPGWYQVMRNPGWEVRGCETYLYSELSLKEVPDGPEFLGAVRVREGRDDLLFATSDSFLHELCSIYFKNHKNTDWFVVPSSSWYHLVNLRTLVYAAERAQTRLGTAVMKATSSLDVWCALRREYEQVDVSTRVEIAGRFRSDSPVNAKGTPRTMLERTPGMMEVMAARFDALLRLCVDPGVDCPSIVGRLMRHPGSGALLADLSQLRTLMGENQPLLAEYSRVLPWGSMSILGSDLFFRLVYWSCLATSRAFKPLHAWELQHMLWNLSSFGTDEERYLFFYDKLCRVFGGVDQARGFSRKLHNAERALRTFDENLGAMGVRDMYLDLDGAFARTIARQAGGRPRRGQVTSVTTRTDAGPASVRSFSTATHSMAQQVAQPIADLQHFGLAEGWGPDTDLHTILNTVRGRVDPQRAYLYWCGLSSVEKPPELPRVSWRPSTDMMSDKALHLRLPGLSTPAAFTRRRDDELRNLL